jgi:WD40 repeat protein
VSPDAKTLATATPHKNTIKVWVVATGKQQMAIKTPESAVRSMVFSPDGKTLVTGGDDGMIRLWDLATGKEVATLTGHKDDVLSLAFSPDGNLLASGSSDSTIKIWNVPGHK